MSCGRCGDQGHNVRTCPVPDGPTPWNKLPEDRAHTKIVTSYDDGITSDEEVPCTCQYFDVGESHYDFDGM